MQKTGIVGASGYSGEVLLDLLVRHPKVSELSVASRSHAGKPVSDVLPRLAGLVDGLQFIQADPKYLSGLDVDVWFLALPHGVAASYAIALVDAGKVVIDLSADFRLGSEELYKAYYGQPHPAPELMKGAPYVIPELLETPLEDELLIACPGCYPTSILVPLVPLMRQGVLEGNSGLVINSLSGVTGAGKKDSLFYSYCERSESALAYGIGSHRHLSEIEEQLGLASGKPVKVQFTPHLVPMMRGIATTIVVPERIDLGQLYEVWEKSFNQRPGVRVLSPGHTPDTRNVTGRTRIDISAVADERTGNLVITTAEDNLLKGASGQAIQIMNLRMGYPEFTGLV